MNIDAETLERLLTDQALGELTPDAQMLLAAYLADHADDRALAEQITRTVSAAKTTLTNPQPVQLPPFPAGALGEAAFWGSGHLARLRANHKSILATRLPLLTKFAALAACVLIGIGLHAVWTANIPPVPHSTGPSHIAEVPNTFAAHPAAPAPANPGFWSARQWYERSERTRSDHGQRVIWDSPLTRPRLGDAT